VDTPSGSASSALDVRVPLLAAVSERHRLVRFSLPLAGVTSVARHVVGAAVNWLGSLVPLGGMGPVHFVPTCPAASGPAAPLLSCGGASTGEPVPCKLGSPGIEHLRIDAEEAPRCRG